MSRSARRVERHPLPGVAFQEERPPGTGARRRLCRVSPEQREVARRKRLAETGPPREIGVRVDLLEDARTPRPAPFAAMGKTKTGIEVGKWLRERNSQNGSKSDEKPQENGSGSLTENCCDAAQGKRKPHLMTAP